MKRIIKLSLFALGAAAASQVAQAQSYNDDDLLLGVANASQDYVVDLGQVPTSANTSLGSFDLTSFGGLAGLSAGVVGGDNDGNIDTQGGNTIFTTTTRVGTAATTYGTAGTETSPAAATPNSINKAISYAYATALGTTATATAQHTAWSQVIAQSSTAAGTSVPSWASQIGNPMAALDANNPVTLDLWTTTDDNNHNTFSYLGDIELIPSGNTVSVIFDPVATPEPSAYALIAGGGLVAFSLRRLLAGKAA